jgi:hypothetical protein
MAGRGIALYRSEVRICPLLVFAPQNNRTLDISNQLGLYEMQAAMFRPMRYLVRASYVGTRDCRLPIYRLQKLSHQTGRVRRPFFIGFPLCS